MGISSEATNDNSIDAVLLKHCCVLLVEDYPANVLVATTYLDNFGYEYEVARDGEEALYKVKTGKRYMAILMDIEMHGMNGFETTKLIREYEKQTCVPYTPIIGMTAHALTGDRERCLAASMNDYLAKPFNPDQLEMKLFLAKDVLIKSI